MLRTQKHEHTDDLRKGTAQPHRKQNMGVISGTEHIAGMHTVSQPKMHAPMASTYSPIGT